FTYSFNPSYTIAEQVKLFANIASGFRAPSLYHLASEYGNTRLQPEKSTSYEGGVQYFNKGNTVNIRVNYFNRIIRDVIIFRSLSAPPYAQYDNADKQKDHGFELEATLLPAARWSIRANYTYTNGKVTTLSPGSGKDSSYYNLYRRPKNTANLTLGYQASAKWYASLGFRWVDKRDDLFYNSNTFSTEQKVLAAYYNLDVYISYQAASFVKIFADLRNITNRQYFDLYGYNSRRFNFMAGILLNF
ncbi:MAG TPA: TonB-dependent receptor, partial [Chitinophagaceae bacterium]|nr:TonB-dependent receptor [Chitinophagaceae bacterium]